MNKPLLTLIFSVLFSHVSFAATQVSGQIRNNTNWTKAGSPYVITGLLEIAPGVKLTIEPGAEVEIDDQIHCYGLIEANGTVTDSIYFRSNYKSNRQWRAIRIYNAKPTDTFIFNYCHFSYGGEILANGNETYIITNSYLGTQAKICNFNGPVNLYLENCYVYYSTIFIVGTVAKINNNIYDKGGIYSRASPYISITENRFDGAGQAVICEGANNLPAVFDIRNNVFENTTITALKVDGFGVATFDTVHHFSGNIFSNNSGVAVNIIYMRGKMSGNSIYDNRIGMTVKSWVGNNAFQMEWNCIYDNDSLNFVNEMASGFQLGPNWWGTTDSSTIALSIFDYGEDFKKGTVVFQPYLTQKICNIPPGSNGIITITENTPRVYPNPFASTLQIEMAQKAVIKEVCLYNVVGEKLVHLVAVNGSKATINTSDLPAGVYIYKIYDTDSKAYSGKVLKQ